MKHHLNPRHKIFSQDDIQEASGMFVSLAYSKKRKLVEFCYPKLIIINFDNCRTFENGKKTTPLISHEPVFFITTL